MRIGTEQNFIISLLEFVALEIVAVYIVPVERRKIAYIENTGISMMNISWKQRSRSPASTRRSRCMSYQDCMNAESKVNSKDVF